MAMYYIHVHANNCVYIYMNVPPLECICSCPWVPHEDRGGLDIAALSGKYLQSTSEQYREPVYHHLSSEET